MSDAADERLGRARAALARAEELAGVHSASRLAVERVFSPLVRPVPASIDEDAATVAAGRVLEVPHGAGPLMRVAAHMVPTHGWLGVVALGDIGWMAAQERGIDLDRVISVPEPGILVADVVATLVEGTDVVCLGPAVLSGAQQRRLAARVRRGGQILLTAVSWPGISRPWTAVGAQTRQEAM